MSHGPMVVLSYGQTIRPYDYKTIGQTMQANILRTPGFLYGYGLFETMLAKKGRVLFLEEHLERLFKSAKKIALPIKQTPSQFTKAIYQEIKPIKSRLTYIRLNAWAGQKGSEFDIITKKYTPPSLQEYSQGWKITLAQNQINENSQLAQIKSLNYLGNYLTRIEAQKKGFNEALFLNTKGFIAEGTRSNIFLVKNGTLLTPSLNCGVLNGIIRQQIIKIAKQNKIPLKETCLKIKDLQSAQEIFLTNSLIGIMPVREAGNFKLKKFRPLTQKISGFYKGMTS